MIVHSDSFIGVLFIFLMFVGTGFALLASTVLLLALKFRLASRVLLGTGVALLIFIVLQGTILALTPQTIVERGDSFCADIWCIGVRDVKATAGEQDVVYKVDVRIFSDANRGGKIHGKAILFLVDERGLRFPLIHDPSVIPFNRELTPQEAIDTTLTFAAAADAQRLYLTGEPAEPASFLARFFTGDWMAEYFTSTHKPTLLRVL